MSDIRFNCASCKQSLEAPPDMAGQLIECPACKQTIEIPIPRPVPKVEPRSQPPPRPRPTAPRPPSPPIPQPKMEVSEGQSNLNMVLGIVGSLVLVLGVFSPLISVPIMGTMNYFQNGKGDGVIVLVLAFISLLLSASRQYRGLWFTGLCSAGCLAFTFINFQIGLDKMKSEMKTELADNPFAGLANLVTQAIQMQWGWAVLIAGIALILVAAAMKSQSQK